MPKGLGQCQERCPLHVLPSLGQNTRATSTHRWSPLFLWEYLGFLTGEKQQRQFYWWGEMSEDCGGRGDRRGAAIPKTMSRVWVSVEPRGFWAVQRYMEPLSSAGTRSSTSSLPSCSVLPSRSRLPTRVQVKRGSGKTSFCGEMGGCETSIEGEQTLPRAQSEDRVQPKHPGCTNVGTTMQPMATNPWLSAGPASPRGDGNGWGC